MSPHCVWIITVGGAVDNEYIANPNIAMLTELGQYMLLCIDYCIHNYIAKIPAKFLRAVSEFCGNLFKNLFCKFNFCMHYLPPCTDFCKFKFE